MNTYYSYSGEYKGEHYKQRLLSSLQLLQLFFFFVDAILVTNCGELPELQFNFISQIHKTHKKSNDVYFFLPF